ncbi:MAG: DUF3352 domain-containing protein [Candidatus Sumerlaeota bacterium]|nr:DUF3352 domain-containing protein [Candidatus Sumerlaeota bacterium]
MSSKWLLALLPLFGLVWLGCGKEEGTVAPKGEKSGMAAAGGATATAPRGPNERFYTVEKELDSGGSFYAYLDIKDALRNTVAQFQPLASDPQAPPEAAKIYTMANQVIDRLGIYGIQDIGMSVAPDGDLNRLKAYISIPERKQKGMMALLGGDPHSFPLLDRMPDDTLIFMCADFDAAAAWNLARQIAQDIGGLEATSQLDQGVNEMKQSTGIDLPSLIPSLTGEFAFAASLDSSSKLKLPDMNPPVLIDSPRLALMIRVKNDSLYQALKQAITKSKPVSEAMESKLRMIAIPTPPIPDWPITPALGYDGDYVYLSTHQDYLKRIAVGAGASLRSSEEFKHLSAGLPAEGNSILYISPRLGKAVAEIGQAVIKSLPQNSPEDRWAQQIIADALKEPPSGSLSVRVNKSDGIQFVSRSKSGAGGIVLAAMGAPVAVMAAIAVPNFLEAQLRAKVSRSQADMRSLATALEAYFIDNGAYCPSSADSSFNLYGGAALRHPELARQPTFVRPPQNPSIKMMSLTTPVAYITRFPDDPYAPEKDITYSYYSCGSGMKSGWILWTPGPDKKYDLTAENITQLYDSKILQPSDILLKHAYDPTNGTMSGGDLFRVKQ